jgi:hypothetical protein
MRTIKECVECAIEGGSAQKIEDFTCYNCGAWKSCPFAFDFYNTHGDCLGEK